VGDVVYPIAPPGQTGNGMVGAGTFGSTASGSNNGNSGSAGTSGGYTVRTNNMLTVRTDNFKGLVGNAFYSMADNNSTPDGASATTNVTGTNNKNGWGIGANYTFKKLLLTANYQSLKAVQTGLGNTNISVWSGTAAANNIQDNQMYFAAAYDFGVLNAYLQYIDRKATSELNSAQFARRTAQQIGVRGFFTKTIEGWASAGMGRYDTFGTTAPTVNFTGYQLGTNYYLSKRSNLYAIFGSTAQSSANVNQPSSGMNNYAVGVRHTF
jgi:predicted porin